MMLRDYEIAIATLTRQRDAAEERARDAEIELSLARLTERVLRASVEAAEARALEARALYERERAARALERQTEAA